MGNRIFRQTFGANSAITWFLFSGEGVISEHNFDRLTIRELGYSPGAKYSAGIVFLKKNIKLTSFILNAHQQTWEIITSITGDIEITRRAGAFDGGSSTNTEKFGFSGQFYETNNLFYNFNRFYSTDTGLYTHSDRIGLGDGLNIYKYAWGNPVRYTDESGLDVFPEGSFGGFGEVVTCDGKNKYQTRVCIKEPCLTKCTQAHERSHMEDYMLMYPKGCTDKPRGLILYASGEEEEEWLVRSECKAHQTSIKCLRDQATVDCKCKASLQNQISDEIETFTSYYRCPERFIFLLESKSKDSQCGCN